MRLVVSLLLMVGLLFVLPAVAGEVLEAGPKAHRLAAMHNAEGIKAFNKNDLKGAEAHFREAVAVDKKLAEAHYNLAITLHKMGNHGEASGHFGHALKYGKENPEIRDSKVLKGHLK